jgi:hypothetical protein
MIKEPTYLGDGVYMSPCRDGGIMLTTGHHLETQADNVIYLEPSVLMNLIQILERAMEQQK